MPNWGVILKMGTPFLLCYCFIDVENAGILCTKIFPGYCEIQHMQLLENWVTHSVCAAFDVTPPP